MSIVIQYLLLITQFQKDQDLKHNDNVIWISVLLQKKQSMKKKSFLLLNVCLKKYSHSISKRSRFKTQRYCYMNFNNSPKKIYKKNHSYYWMFVWRKYSNIRIWSCWRYDDYKRININCRHNATPCFSYICWWFQAKSWKPLYH